MDWKENGGGIL